jgi:DNA-directed RNA polymerase subunit K/omega
VGGARGDVVGELIVAADEQLGDLEGEEPPLEVALEEVADVEVED